MLRIGLTGGIGSGKSTVAGLFAARGVPVIDADDIARRLAAPGQPAYREIVAQFGPAILDPERRIDRKLLRRRVFEQPAERLRLEAILHPQVRRAMEDEIAGLDTPYCILVIPLLFETAERFPVDRVLVVDADEARQIERAGRRDGADAEEIIRILAAQLPRAERLRRAHDVVRNDAGLAELETEVECLHRFYLQLAHHSG
ncbi:MAG: dephospho-CoA kinase [Gammaproteobacteria bacterium]|nr:dephospho-CoA kinase [Gammaproteobacteria bacterium]